MRDGEISPGPAQLDPRRDHAALADADRPGSRLRGGRAGRRAGGALPRRRGLPERHRRRARAGARGRRPRSARGGRARSRASSRASSRTPSTDAPSATCEWLDSTSPALKPPTAAAGGAHTRPTVPRWTRALRRDPARRHGRRRHGAHRRGEAAGRAPPRRARGRPDRGRLSGLKPEGARALRAACQRGARQRRDRRLRDDPPARSRPPATRASRCSPTASRRSARSWARASLLHVEKVVRACARRTSR